MEIAFSPIFDASVVANTLRYFLLETVGEHFNM